ncbi:helix-turn-helix domain-containing protein [Actinomadura sp. 6N118]|uniref:helix-turn-helix domain-containing protein n=1 Tax=Actinomadura sp. 6N118 TaxID=3375151 RepID=UPI003791624F
MGRPERPLDPHAGPVERLAWELRRLREEAGRPSYRELAQRAHFARSSLAEAATGLRFPTLEATLAYATACGADRAEWERRWRETEAELAHSRRRCPYPGLTPFGGDDADLFFGRAALVDDLLKAVERARLIAVFGASGSGKSSLLLAGLLPALAAEGIPTAVMTPGSHPAAELARHLESLSTDALLVVDQFEEAFTLCTDQEERSTFLAALISATTGEQPITVVLGVRSDFYGHCAAEPELAAALPDGVQLPIGPMSQEDLRAIVVEPAARVGLSVEPDLVATVVAEAMGRPGALPLVAHALRETWRRQRGDTLRLADYEAAGGVGEAIAKTAESVYEELDEPRREIARNVFLRLTVLGEGTEDTRRRIDREELTGLADPGEIDTVLEALAGAWLVVMDEGDLEISHEALIDAWPWLREWLDEDREALRRRQRLTNAAADWDGHARDPEFLYRGSRLAEWDDGDSGGLNEVEQAFLDAGRLAETERVASARRRRRQRTGVLGIVAIVVGVLVVIALVQADRGADDRDRAFSRKLATEARRQLTLDPALALLLATRAYETAPTAEADSVLRRRVPKAWRSLPTAGRVRV